MSNELVIPGLVNVPSKYASDEVFSEVSKAGDFLERAEEDGYEFSNENGDPLFDVDMDQMKDLQQRVRSAIEQWQAAHKLVFMPWTFTGQRNLEYISGEMGAS